jgi:Protein of unknown function (DUF1360)
MDPTAGHSEQYRPLGAYAALMGAFGALSAVGLAAGSRAGVLPDHFRAGDLALCGVASYKLSRLLARDRITSALRAPFTRFQGDAGHGEVDEAARGRGMRRAVGELLVCPDCLGLWVAGAFTAGLVARPEATRAVAAALTIHAASDALQSTDSATRQKA